MRTLNESFRPEQSRQGIAGLHGSPLLSLEPLEACLPYRSTAVIFNFFLEFRKKRIVVLFVSIAIAV
jgi:hypothetical protein